MLLRQAAPLRHQALDAIRAAIISGEFPPGVRLKERELCELLGVSRTVVRESLRQLESEQLVRIEPQVGPIVATLTIRDVENLYEARAALEAAAGKLAARDGNAEAIAELVAVYDQIVLAEELAMDDLIELKNLFYDKLVAAADNQVIGEMLNNIRARISQLRRITLGAPGRHKEMVVELGQVLEAIKSGDAEAAHAACISHVKSAEKIALHDLSQREA
jgi:GntR family transcriptional regulator, trigonelline degradation regulator